MTQPTTSSSSVGSTTSSSSPSSSIFPPIASTPLFHLRHHSHVQRIINNDPGLSFRIQQAERALKGLQITVTNTSSQTTTLAFQSVFPSASSSEVAESKTAPVSASSPSASESSATVTPDQNEESTAPPLSRWESTFEEEFGFDPNHPPEDLIPTNPSGKSSNATEQEEPSLRDFSSDPVPDDLYS